MFLSSVPLLLAVSAAIGCAPQPQAREQPVPSEQAPPRWQPAPCPLQVIGYEDPTPLGPSAAQIVAQFGSERRAALVAPKPARGLALPGEIRVRVVYAGGDVKVARCPTSLVQLSMPVRVVLGPDQAPEVVFDANLLAGDASEVRVQGSAPLFGSSATVFMRLDADDVDLTLPDRRDLPAELHWTSSCRAEASSFVNDFFAAVPGPLLRSGLSQALTCLKAAEPARAVQLAGARQMPPLLLNAVDSRGCRDLGQRKVARFRGEVVASGDTTWMPHPASANISVDVNAGIAKVAFQSKLPSSDWLRAFHACAPPSEGAALSYWLELERSPAGVAPKSEVFELTFGCQGVVVRCSSVAP